MTLHDSPQPDVGPLEDEAAALVEALQYWAQQRLLPVADQFGGSEECAICPVCRFMAMVRGEKPEVVEHLAQAAGALAAAFAAAVSSDPAPTGGTRQGEPGHRGPHGPSGDPTADGSVADDAQAV